MKEDLVPVKQKGSKVTELNFLHRIETGYPIIVRETVAEKLANVANNLPPNLRLQLDSGYRSRKTQERIFKMRLNQFGSNFKKTEKLVFNPDKGTPPHTTGGAVDVSLTDESGKEINLSSPFIKFYMEPKPLSKKITKEAQKLRILLRTLMLAEEFAPNPREYWHFSYGDESWSNFYKKPVLYKEISNNHILKYSKHKIAAYSGLRLLWRVKNKIFKIKTNY